MKLSIIWMFALCCGASAYAQEKTDKPLVWYDNGYPREVWIDPDLVVEFNTANASHNRAMPTAPAARILRRSEIEGRRASAAGRTSPVLRDTPGGAIRALPGNVLLQLDPRWTAAQVSSWLSAQGLSEVARLPIASNVVVVHSPPGLAALELANRLQETGEVRWAQPDWWQPLVPR